jgi:cyclopropane fatty-acyl-phospholipid synthase-like methyltransferase
MVYDGSAFFDDDVVFKTYMTRRQRENNPNDTLEKPVVLELAGALTNQRILDLGCGDGTFGREALTKSCQSYLGVEGSSKMVSVAQKVLDGTTAKVIHAMVENWSYPTQDFDLVISRPVLHYVKMLIPFSDRYTKRLRIMDGCVFR